MLRPVAVALGLWISTAAAVFAQDRAQRAPFEEFLLQGKTLDAERVLAQGLAAQPADPNARFALGVVQFLRAVEGRMQAFHRHGFRTGSLLGMLPFTHLPIPPNPNPEPLDYKTARSILQGWVDDLARVEATLALVQAADVKVPLPFGLIRLDFNGDGRADDGETLWRIYNNFNTGANVSAEGAQKFVIACDRGDVDWLRGYCHVLAALTEALLAHNFEEVFNRTGYLFFGGIKAPDAFLVAPNPPNNGLDFGEILDLAALVHLIRLPVAEPARLQAALAHLEAMVSLSRSSWKFILAETDNDREWIPNPRQNSVLPNGRVTDEMVQTWTQFLDEFAAILAGKQLIPFWRGNDLKLGINFRRIGTEPRPFDLVLWLQGTAAVPYLEAGPISSPATWSRFNRVFRGEFIGFALWFN